MKKIFSALALSFQIAAFGYARTELVTVDLSRRTSPVNWTWTADADSAVRVTVKSDGSDFDLREWGAYLFVGDANLATDIPGSNASFNHFTFDVTRQYLPTNGKYTVQIIATNATGRVEEWARGNVTVRANPAIEAMPATWNGYVYLAARIAPLVTRQLVIEEVAATTTVMKAELKDYVDEQIEGCGIVTPQAVTNIAGRVTSNVVTKAYVEALGISGGGITTNDVSAVIASLNLCTVAEARAMTNDATIVRGANSSGKWVIWVHNADSATDASFVPWSGVSGKPDTISGYGITNAYAKSEADGRFRGVNDNICHADYGMDRWSFSGGVTAGVTYTMQHTGMEWQASGSDGSNWTEDMTNVGPDAMQVSMIGYVDGELKYMTAKREKIATAGQPFVTADNVPSTNGLVAAAVAGAKSYADANFVKSVTTNGVAVPMVNGTVSLAIPQGGGGGGGVDPSVVENMIKQAMRKSTHVYIPKNSWSTATPFSGNTVIEEVEGYDGGSLFNCKHMYANCFNLKRVRCTGNGNGMVWSGVTIGERCFFNCTNLVEIDFGTGTYNGKIGAQAFENCPKLGRVVFPEGITGASDQVFMGILAPIALTNIVFPATWKALGSYVIAGGPCNGVDYTFKANAAEITIAGWATFAYMPFQNSTARFPNSTMAEVLAAFQAETTTGTIWRGRWYEAGRNNTFVCSDGSFTTP